MERKSEELDVNWRTRYRAEEDTSCSVSSDSMSTDELEESSSAVHVSLLAGLLAKVDLDGSMAVDHNKESVDEQFASSMVEGHKSFDEEPEECRDTTISNESLLMSSFSQLGSVIKQIGNNNEKDDSVLVRAMDLDTSVFILDERVSRAATDEDQSPNKQPPELASLVKSESARSTELEKPKICTKTQIRRSLLSTIQPGSSHEDLESSLLGSLFNVSSVEAPHVPTVEQTTKGPPDSPLERLTMEELFDEESGLPRLKVLKGHFERGGLLAEEAAIRIISRAEEILRAQPNVLSINAPATICGDLHGRQFRELLDVLRMAGDLSATKAHNYLFLGNYVDMEGCFGTEIILYLWSLKIHYPTSLHFLRGNYDCERYSSNLMDECHSKYSDELYEAILRTFNCLSLAAVLDGKIFCVHGGISELAPTIDAINKVDRFQEPNCKCTAKNTYESSSEHVCESIICHMLWSDPCAGYDEESSDHELKFSFNTKRGFGCNYNYEAVCTFLKGNKLQSIIRSNQSYKAGYNEYRKRDGFPSLVTVFSAANYLGICNNQGSIVKYKNGVYEYEQFPKRPLLKKQSYSLPPKFDT